MTRRSRADWSEILAPMIDAGQTPRQMAVALGSDYRSVCRALRNIGRPYGRDMAAQEARAARMVALRNAGWSYDAIAAEMGLGSRAAVYGVLRRRGMTGQNVRAKSAMRGVIAKLNDQERSDYRNAMAKRFSAREALRIIGRTDLLEDA